MWHSWIEIKYYYPMCSKDRVTAPIVSMFVCRDKMSSLSELHVGMLAASFATYE